MKWATVGIRKRKEYEGPRVGVGPALAVGVESAAAGDLPLTARRILKLSLEKMRLLSASLGPLICRTLDHLLCPAGTAAVRCSVLPGAGVQPMGSGWEAARVGGRAARTPGPRAPRKPRAATLLRLTAAQAAISFDLGPRSARTADERRPRSARGVRGGNEQVPSLRPPPPVTRNPTAQASPAQPRYKRPDNIPAEAGSGALDNVAHFLSPGPFQKPAPTARKLRSVARYLLLSRTCAEPGSRWGRLLESN